MPASAFFLGASLSQPGGSWVRAASSGADSSQQPHAGELGRQEGVEDEHDRLRTRVEVKHLQRAIMIIIIVYNSVINNNSNNSVSNNSFF